MSADLDPSGVQTEAAAPATDETSIAQAEPSESGQEQSVPLSALQSERAQRQQMQDELKMMKEHLTLLQTNQAQPRVEKQKDELDELDDGDVLTVGEAKKFLGRMQRNHQSSIEELKMTQKHSDYQEVITKYLPEVLKENPGLRNTLQQTQDYELAYHLAKNSDVYRKENKKTKQSVEAQRIVENSQKVGSLSSMGSTSPISQARRYRDMPLDDFRALVGKNLGGP